MYRSWYDNTPILSGVQSGSMEAPFSSAERYCIPDSSSYWMATASKGPGSAWGTFTKKVARHCDWPDSVHTLRFVLNFPEWDGRCRQGLAVEGLCPLLGERLHQLGWQSVAREPPWEAEGQLCGGPNQTIVYNIYIYIYIIYTVYTHFLFYKAIL